jgi:cardiolipin synthase
VSREASGNRLTLLKSGSEYFPALLAAIDSARREIWLETYLFADDTIGREVASALVHAVSRGVKVRLMVDGWGAKAFLTRALELELVAGGVTLLKYRPEVRPWHFRSHRLRRLHRKLCHVDGAVAFVGGINVIDDMNTPRHRPPRVDFAVRVEGLLLAPIVQTMQRVWAINERIQLRSTDVPLFPEAPHVAPVGNQVARFVIRDNLRHRRDIEHAYLQAIGVAKQEILIANSYFFPGIRFRHALMEAVERGVRVTLLLQGRVEYVLLHFASRALYGQLLVAGIVIQEYRRSMLHAKVAVIDDKWATVGSSNIDPYSLLMAREANVIVRDVEFAGQLKRELEQMIEFGAERVGSLDWAGRSRLYKAVIWISYGIVRVAMGILGYGGNEWFRGRK